MHKLALFRLHLIVFLWGFTAILGKLIHANAEILVFYRMLFAAICLFLYIRVFKKDSIKVSKKVFFQLAAIGFSMAIHWYCFFYSIKISNVSTERCLEKQAQEILFFMKYSQDGLFY